MNSSFTLAEASSMLADRKAGATYVAIGKKYGCCKGHARGICRGLRGPLKYQTNLQLPRKGADTKHKAKELKAKGLHYKEIAKRLGISEGYCSGIVSSGPRKAKAQVRWMGEIEPSWSHDLSEKWRWSWADINSQTRIRNEQE